MGNRLSFTNLPIPLGRHQVLYVEYMYNESINSLINTQYQPIRQAFMNAGYEFVYIPKLMEDKDLETKVRYYAPYLQSDIVEKVHYDSSYILNYLTDPESRTSVKPSLLISLYPSDSKVIEYQAIAIDDIFTPDSDYDHTDSDCIADILLHRVLNENKEGINKILIDFHDRGGVKYHIVEDTDLPTTDEKPTFTPRPRKPRREAYSVKLPIDYDKLLQEESAAMAAEEERCAEEDRLAELLFNLEQTVRKLRINGISLMAIHEFIDKQETISRLVITSDYRIFLPDYNNIEIEMGPLPKALFFLFLLYEDGLVFKELPEHYKELLHIYRQLKPGVSEERMALTIDKVTNPFGNAINENVARIRKAFVEKFDERLARHYFIFGEKGEKYRIVLDRQLITWEE